MFSAGNCACHCCPMYALHLAVIVTEWLAWFCKWFEPVLRSPWSVDGWVAMGYKWQTSVLVLVPQIRDFKWMFCFCPYKDFLSYLLFPLFCCVKETSSAVMLWEDFWWVFPHYSLYFIFLITLFIYPFTKGQYHFSSQWLAKVVWGTAKGMVKTLVFLHVLGSHQIPRLPHWDRNIWHASWNM